MGQQRPQNVGVRRRRGWAAGGDQPRVAGAGGKGSGIDQISVVAQRNTGASGGVAEHGLGVLPRRVPGGGVTTVPDGDMALHGRQRLLVEHLADQAEVFEDQHLGAVGDGDPGGFLAAMLQRVQAVVGEFGDVFTRGPDPEDTALFPGRVQVLLGLLADHGLAAPCGAVGDVIRVYGHDVCTAEFGLRVGHPGATLTHHSRSSARRNQPRSTSGNQASISPAREPESCSAPLPRACATPDSPVATRSQVRGSVCTTLGGVPRVCRGPEMHCTAANGGIRTSTLAPGASAASVRAVSRTAAANTSVSGAGNVSSRNQSARANTTCRVFAGSTRSRALIP